MVSSSYSYSSASHMVALLSNDTIVTWGPNRNGQLGLGNHIQSAATPQVVTPERRFITVAVGAESSYAISDDFSLWAFGSNMNGQLGDGTQTNRDHPVQIGRDHDWIAVAAGHHFTIGLKRNGDIHGWGLNFDGQLGNVVPERSLAPAHMFPGSKWKAVSAGETHAFAIKRDGTLHGWGSNLNKQLGVRLAGANAGETRVPVRIGEANNWKSVHCGGSHTLALNERGELFSWGNNQFGELGTGTRGPGYQPAQVSSPAPGVAWTSVSAGPGRSMGITSDGSLYSWGDNHNTPVRIGEDLGPWASVSSPSGSLLAITQNGVLYSLPLQPGLSTKLVPLTCAQPHPMVKSAASGKRILMKLRSLFKR